MNGRRNIFTHVCDCFLDDCLHDCVIENESVPEITINNAINVFLTGMTILVISNHNSFRVLFDKIASMSFT